MITGEEWKEEETKRTLDYPMAKRYAEAGTVFLFSGENGGPILAGQIKRLSPNGQYALLGPESGPQAAWCPISAITVLDVLVPWREKQEQPIIRTNEDALAALLGIDPSLIAAMPPKKPRKGKDKQ